MLAVRIEAQTSSESWTRRQATTSDTPWIIAHFGFNNVSAYVEWVSLLDDEALFDHIAELLELIINENE